MNGDESRRAQSEDECAELLDPVTGELVSVDDRVGLLKLHDRLEEVALDLLSTCRSIVEVLSQRSHAPASDGTRLTMSVAGVQAHGHDVS